jgi:HAD superfamily hydrolase (TIGR01509 family)
MSPHTKQLIIHYSDSHEILAESDLDNPLPQQSVMKKDTVIAFDLHGVIFQMSPLLVIKHLIKCPSKKSFFRLLLNIPFMYHFIRTICYKKVIDEWIFSFAKKYKDFAQIQTTAFEVANAQKPTPNIKKLLFKLKKQHYKLYIFSNIGEQSIAILQKRFPEIFELFDTIIYSSPKDNYVAKPSSAAFEKLFKTTAENQSYVFIDDNKKNIKKARDFNIYGIRFINTLLLEDTLHQIGILS